jgi:hypothetical protein
VSKSGLKQRFERQKNIEVTAMMALNMMRKFVQQL